MILVTGIAAGNKDAVAYMDAVKRYDMDLTALFIRRSLFLRQLADFSFCKKLLLSVPHRNLKNGNEPSGEAYVSVSWRCRRQVTKSWRNEVMQETMMAAIITESIKFESDVKEVAVRTGGHLHITPQEEPGNVRVMRGILYKCDSNDSNDQDNDSQRKDHHQENFLAKRNLDIPQHPNGD